MGGAAGNDLSQSLEAYLGQHDFVDVQALNRAQQTGEESGERWPIVLASLGLVPSQDLAVKLAEFSSVPVVTEIDFPPEAIEIEGLNHTFLKNAHMLPLGFTESGLRVAMADPTDRKALEAIEFAVGGKVAHCVAPLSELDDAIARLYFGEDGDGGEFEEDSSAEADLARLTEIAGDAPTIRYLDRLIALAIARNASDIHLEPHEQGARARLRVDGILEDADSPPRSIYSAVVSRTKILANLDIAENRLPQDGRFKLDIEGKSLDFRVSTTPTLYGESVVLRLLERGKLPGDFMILGFSEDASATILAHLEKPDGIILVTGPTGSGKTTTLYSALQMLNSSERKILTVEDPIEYMLKGINQVQVEDKIGRTFASSLRSFLRQDPDVMMVGEIRDPETAEIAIQASLTGHLVLSTLHTNSAAGALTRLLDMGVDEYLIASTVSLIIGQRLVRTTCLHCEGLGCDECAGSGVGGRTVIAELLEMDDGIRSLVRSRADMQGIEAVAIKNGMMTMLEQGKAKVRDGATNMEEVLRVVRKEAAT